MKSSPKFHSSWRDCLVSGLGFCGSFIAWNLWFVNGGWHRDQHLGEVVLWAASILIGIWAAVDVMRRERELTPATVLAAVLCVLNSFSCLLFLFFLCMLLQGGHPR